MFSKETWLRYCDLFLRAEKPVSITFCSVLGVLSMALLTHWRQ